MGGAWWPSPTCGWGRAPSQHRVRGCPFKSRLTCHDSVSSSTVSLPPPTFHGARPQACPGPPTSGASHLWGQPLLQTSLLGPGPKLPGGGACSGSHSTLLLRLQQLQQPCNKRLRVESEVPKLTHAVVLSTDPKSFLNTHHHHTQWLLVTFTRSDLFTRIQENLS